MAENIRFRFRSVESDLSRMHRTTKQVHEFNLLGLLLRFWREKTIIIISGLVVFGLALSAAMIVAPRYTSIASVIPPGLNTGSSAAAALAGQLSSIGAGTLLGTPKTPSDLYVGILKSQSISGELVQRFNLRSVYGVKKESQAEKVLADNSSFEVGSKDSILTIAITDKSAARARDLANGYLDALRRTNGRLALNEASQRRLFFDEQLAKEKDKLADAEVDLKRTEEQSGFIDPTNQTVSEIQIIAQTRSQISARQTELSGLLQSDTEQNHEVVRLRAEISDLEGQLVRLNSGSGKTGAGIPTSQVPAAALDHVRKEREVKYHEALFEMLSRQYESAGLDEAHNAPLLQVLDPASYPDSKSGPPRTLIALGGLFLGLLGGCAWVLVRARLGFDRSTLKKRSGLSN